MVHNLPQQYFIIYLPAKKCPEKMFLAVIILSTIQVLQ